MASIKRHASANWQGSGKDGTGSLTTQSATLKDTPYSFNARFGDGKGTNPEELIAAVHLVLRAKVPGLDAAKFQELAAGAKANCPVSKVLNAAITLDATLE